MLVISDKSQISKLPDIENAWRENLITIEDGVRIAFSLRSKPVGGIG